MKRLTKEDILEGTRRRVNLLVKEYGREVNLRPLSDEEITQILSKIALPIADDGSSKDSKVDLQKNFEALRLAVSLGGRTPIDLRRGRENEIWGSGIYRILHSPVKWSEFAGCY